MIKWHSISSSIRALVAIAALGVCSVGYAQPFENCPNPLGGNCSEETIGTPGCRFQSCCEFICSSDPLCCEVEWDDFCALLGEITCEYCNAGEGDCLAENDTPGCEDAAPAVPH